MIGRKNIGILFALALSAGLLSASVAALLTADYCARRQYELLDRVCGKIIEEQPEAESVVGAALKEEKMSPKKSEGESFLPALGFRRADFLLSDQKMTAVFAAAGFFCGGLLLLAAFWYQNRRDSKRIEELTEYLELVNTGGPGLLLQEKDDRFSKLQDELYKTVTYACQTRDAALESRRNFADNLSNIAHQLKTPITAISLSAQMIKEPQAKEYAGENARENAGQIEKQLKRLTRLEEALLLLSRLDAGTLPLEQKAVDVFTVLTLAAENLQELFLENGVSMDIPEAGEAGMIADMDWTMEAVMNLMKNCMEHTPRGGAVHCSYEQNPLYTQILIWDDGEGFAKEDIPRLFQRFYRGKNAGNGGIGIGLSLAKAIIESENGTISARNLPEGGACFDIRFYSH